jgi:hypothetical protein
MVLRRTLRDENAFRLATAFHGSATLPVVISPSHEPIQMEATNLPLSSEAVT